MAKAINAWVETLLDPQTRSDPYPLYRELRAFGRSVWCEGLQGWLVTRYADCEAVLQHPQLSYGGGLMAMFQHLTTEQQREFIPLRRHIELGMGSMNPPQHTRIRSPMNRAFTTRVISRQAPYTERITDEILDAALTSGNLEVVGSLAYPLPAMVIANLLGTTGDDNHHLFLRCSDCLGDLFGSTAPSLDVLKAAQDSMLALSAHLHESIAQRRGKPGKDDLLSLLVGTPYDHDLSEEEIVANCIELLFAGHLTITTMLGTCVLTLLRHPEVAHHIQRDDNLLNNAIEEILRYDGPMQMIRRMASEDLELAGESIKKGEMVWAVLGAANRDERRYEEPERLDVNRNSIRHLAFGVGVHYCIGASLARLEAEIVLRRMLQRLPNMRLQSEKVEWYDLPIVRSLKALHITFDA